MQDCKNTTVWGDACRKMPGCLTEHFFLDHENDLQYAEQLGKGKGLWRVNDHIKSVDRVEGCGMVEKVRQELLRRKEIIENMSDAPSRERC